jgi:hypothetical protein
MACSQLLISDRLAGEIDGIERVVGIYKLLLLQAELACVVEQTTYEGMPT